MNSWQSRSIDHVRDGLKMMYSSIIDKLQLSTSSCKVLAQLYSVTGASTKAVKCRVRAHTACRRAQFLLN